MLLGDAKDIAQDLEVPWYAKTDRSISKHLLFMKGPSINLHSSLLLEGQGGGVWYEMIIYSLPVAILTKTEAFHEVMRNHISRYTLKILNSKMEVDGWKMTFLFNWGDF